MWILINNHPVNVLNIIQITPVQEITAKMYQDLVGIDVYQTRIKLGHIQLSDFPHYLFIVKVKQDGVISRYACKGTDKELINKKLEEFLLLTNSITASLPRVDWPKNNLVEDKALINNITITI